MINQELKALGRKYQMLPNFGSVAKGQGGSKLQVFAPVCEVFALPLWHLLLFKIAFFECSIVTSNQLHFVDNLHLQFQVAGCNSTGIAHVTLPFTCLRILVHHLS